jgi:hypothetical protein
MIEPGKKSNFINIRFWFCCVIVINLVVVFFSCISTNEYLKWSSYQLYGLQLITMPLYLYAKAKKVKNLFLPSFFILNYFLISQTLGSYLVPRGFGWYKGFELTTTSIENYNTIVPYLLLANFALFVLSCASFRRLQREVLSPTKIYLNTKASLEVVLKSVVFLAFFFAVSCFDLYQAFSFQLAIMVGHITSKQLNATALRWMVYATYLIIFLSFTYDNKRELAMAIFLIAFVEMHAKEYKLELSIRGFLNFTAFALVFFIMVMAASIMRGYGNFSPNSFFDAIIYIPQYIVSDNFVDGITDNLELNYSYGVTVTAMDHVLTQKMHYLYGESFIKVFFLPVSREFFPFKPESAMLLFTKEYSYEWWIEGGSLPISLPAEAFMNFNYFGLVAFTAIVFLLNRFFVRFSYNKGSEFAKYSYLFLFITVLMFARGSGIDQYVLYYLFAAPVLLLIAFSNKLTACKV